ncbi:Ca(2+)-dependent cysteine protease [Ceratobasidium sp. 414]|nr:Ca(2+)-dependent cysteine protease [Ceratobasidium sp. 414]
MGKPSNAQTGNGPSDTFAPQSVAPVTVARPTTQTKSPPTSTLTASLTLRPPLPSRQSSLVRHPDATSVDDGEEETFHDAFDQIPVDSAIPQAQTSSSKPQRTSGLQQSPLPAQHTTPENEFIYYEGDNFYDAPEYQASTLFPAKPQRASGVQQAPDPLEGASKGKMNIAPRRGARGTTQTSPSAVYYSPAPGRGSCRPAASSTAAPTPNPPTFGTQPLPSFPPAPLFGSVTTPVKKALLIGVDYRTTSNPLRHATKDAIKFGKVLNETLKFPEENLVFITDMAHNTPSCFTPGPKRNQGVGLGWNLPNGTGWQGPIQVKDKKRFVESTRHNMIEGFRWLIRGAKAGDDLVMLFSGHCSYHDGKGPYLVTTGGAGAVEDMVSKNDLLDELVLKVPAGCRLQRPEITQPIFAQIVFDCCHSSALVDLQYCVGSMRPDLRGQSPSEADQPEEVNSEDVRSEETAVAHHITPKLTQAPAPVSTLTCVPTPKNPPTSADPEHQGPIHGSLYGVFQALVPQEPLPPGSFNVETFAPPAATPGPNRASKRPGGVVAAPPPTNSESATSAGATSWFSWAKEMVAAAAPASAPASAPVSAPVSASVSAPSSAPASATPAASKDAKPIASSNQSAEVRRARNFIAEAPRPTDHFEERTEGYVKPVGQVVCILLVVHEPTRADH